MFLLWYRFPWITCYYRYCFFGRGFVTDAGVSFNRKPSFGFGIRNTLLTFCRCCMNIFVCINLLLRFLSCISSKFNIFESFTCLLYSKISKYSMYFTINNIKNNLFNVFNTEFYNQQWYASYDVEIVKNIFEPNPNKKGNKIIKYYIHNFKDFNIFDYGRFYRYFKKRLKGKNEITDLEFYFMDRAGIVRTSRTKLNGYKLDIWNDKHISNIYGKIMKGQYLYREELIKVGKIKNQSYLFEGLPVPYFNHCDHRFLGVKIYSIKRRNYTP